MYHDFYEYLKHCGLHEEGI